MSDALVPIGNHLFDPDQLRKIAQAALAEHPDAHSVLKGGVDSKGASVVLAMSGAFGEDGQKAWEFQTSWSYDWRKPGSVYGVGGSVAW